MQSPFSLYRAQRDPRFTFAGSGVCFCGMVFGGVIQLQITATRPSGNYFNKTKIIKVFVLKKKTSRPSSFPMKMVNFVNRVITPEYDTIAQDRMTTDLMTLMTSDFDDSNQ